MEYVNDSYFQTVWALIASVGWYVVGLAVIVYLAFPHIEEKYKNWILGRRHEDVSDKKTDQLPQMSANVELARQKLQEAYNNSCILAQQKEEEEKEKKKQKILKMLEKKNVGKKLGTSDSTKEENDEIPNTSSKSKSFKSEYNPLMGNNTRGYRPPKRSCCGKGGCG